MPMVIQLPPDIEANPKFAHVVAACSEIYVLPSELAERWRLSQLRLGALRRAGKGPPWIKLGGDGTGGDGTGGVRYRMSDILLHELKGYAGPITPARLRLAVSMLPEFNSQEKALIGAYLSAHLFPKE
jgi:hypothetical protein